MLNDFKEKNQEEDSMRTIEEDGDEDEKMRFSLRFLVLLYPDLFQPSLP